MDPVRGQPQEHAQVADRPNNVTEISLHLASKSCRWLRQQGGHDAASRVWVKSKNRPLPAISVQILASILCLIALPAPGQDEPMTEEHYQREELGVNPYTAPSIATIFDQLDELKPIPFDKLWRSLPASSPSLRETKAMVFGVLIADGFLVVTAERKNLIEALGRALLREARGLGVADRVMKHSASLTELGKRGEWMAVRKELVTTQADVEQALIDLRDQKIAHLISLGGWLRGLEISAGAVDEKFSKERAAILVQF